MTATLDQIARTTNTDKSSLHGYCDFYDQLFTPLRDKPVRLLEVGILGGDSLLMWAQYFEHPTAEIWGCDIHDRNFQSNDRRIATVYGDASDAQFMDTLAAQAKWDVAIDDGAHMASHQVQFFNSVWPHMKPGGFLVVEDTHTVHSPVHCDFPINIIQYFAHVAIQMQDPRGADGSAKQNPEHPYSDIESIEFRKGLIIVRKRA